LRLGRAGGDARFARGAGAVLDRERRFVCTDDAGGAEPETSQTEGRGVCAWCRGSAGVGLARLGCRDLSDDTDFAGEIEAALAATRDAPMALVDHLCCGELGRNDFLLTAGLRLDRPDLVQLARDRAAAVLARAEERGGFVWRHGDDSLNPGLFQGVAGIGYQLLRLRDPAALPSVLLWD
jgi:lantibiotic modifying enzyme